MVFLTATGKPAPPIISYQDFELHQWLDHLKKCVLVIVCKEEGLSLDFGSR